MNISQILEARYAGRYRIEDVLAQYDKAMIFQSIPDAVLLHSAVDREDRIIARFYVDKDGDEDVIRNLVKEYHTKYNIPFGEISEMIKLADDWAVYVHYKGPA